MDQRWQPWSQRVGRRSVSVPSRDVEDHMRAVLGQWILRRAASFNATSDPDGIAALFGARLEWKGIGGVTDFVKRAQEDTESYFDAIELLMRANLGRQGEPAGGSIEALETALSMCGSAWTVAPSKDRLVERIDDTALEQARSATQVPDYATADLLEAWNRAFGRQPDASDASDAWDHAIKAVEHIYSPLVLSGQAMNDKSTLGKVIGELTLNRVGWIAEVSTAPNDPHSGVDVIRSMLQALWGNPDRHGGGSKWRQPQLPEAQALVPVAVTLVQWGRQGVLRRASP